MEKQQYDELKAQQSTHWWFVGKKEIVLDFAAFHAGLRPGGDARILDVGCGMGLMLDALTAYGHVSGMDTEQSAVDYCCAHCRDSALDCTVCVGALPDDVPFPQGSFDYIFALDVLEHVENDCAALETLKRLLRPGGRLIVTVPACMSLWSYNDELNHHWRRYEKQELLEKTQAAGFRILKCSFYNSHLFWPAWLVRHLKNFLHIQTTDVRDSGGAVNSLLKRIFVSEKRRLRRGAFRRGVSLIMACELR